MTIPGLEELREILRDDRLNLAIGNILALEMARDRSVLRARVNLFPELIEIVCKVSWDSVGPEAGVYQIPSVNDMVIVGFIDGHEDEAFILRRLSSIEDKIPLAATEGNLVLRALRGTSTFLNSDTEINLTRGDNSGDERIVLGDTFKEAYSAHLEIDSRHGHIGNMGFNTLPPNEASEYIAIKTSPIDDDLFLSDLSRTEK